jgi:hypothetical protein
MRLLVYFWSCLDLLWHSFFYPKDVYYFPEEETKGMIYNQTYFYLGNEYRYLGNGYLLAI